MVVGEISKAASVVFWTILRPGQRFFDESLLINLFKAAFYAALSFFSGNRFFSFRGSRLDDRP